MMIFESFFLFRKRLTLFTPVLIGSLPIENGVVRAGVKEAGVEKWPAEKGPIRYVEKI